MGDGAKLRPNGLSIAYEVSWASAVEALRSRRQLFLGGLNEKNRGYRKAVQARRSEGGPAGSRPARHHRNGGQGFWPAEGAYRALPRRRIRRGFPAQGEDRG